MCKIKGYSSRYSILHKILTNSIASTSEKVIYSKVHVTISLIVHKISVPVLLNPLTTKVIISPLETSIPPTLFS